MAVCVICKKEIGFASVDISENVKTHLDCFYDDDIPNVSSSNNEERRTAIEKKVGKLIEEYDN